jgi:hypothetical protein
MSSTSSTHETIQAGRQAERLGQVKTLHAALANALAGCVELQGALDQGDIADAIEWLEALQADAARALLEVR